MGDDIRAPVLWRRPNAKTYTYNQQFGGSYYKPMVDYINKKERQGIFWEKPLEKVHLPDPAETYMAREVPRLEAVSGVGDLDDFLIRSRCGRMREVNGASAKTRMKMLNAVTSMGHLPHGRSDNQQTHYDSVRLLKGAAPGRKQVSFYSSELNCLRNSKLFSSRCQTDHMADVLAGNFDWSVHHTGMGGITPDQKFYDPERVKDYTGSIRFKDPERAVPVLA